MKIDRNIRTAFSEQQARNALLREDVDEICRNADSYWHYESRLKSEESFALKVEAGMSGDNLVIDDFFGCTIVVPTVSQLERAKDFVQSNFTVAYTRPEQGRPSKLRPTDFSFNELRLYSTVRADRYGIPPEYTDVVFEIQIKTFLQHAWSVATHDLTYKSNSINWAKVRIASEIKAILEHVDHSIERVESLASSPAIKRDYDEYRRLSDIVDLLTRHWQEGQLPINDVIRLSRSVDKIIDILGISVELLDNALVEEAARGKGSALQDLSPYGAVLQTIFDRFSENVQAPKGRPPRSPIVVSSQIELPSSLPALNPKYFRII